MSSYVDTSAAAKLLVEETQSRALASYLDRLAAADVPLVSSRLLETELRRLAMRENLSQASVSDVLERISLAEPSRSLFYEAGLLPGPNLRTLDALHLATALRVAADELVAYDARLLAAAASVGLRTVSP